MDEKGMAVIISLLIYLSMFWVTGIFIRWETLDDENKPRPRRRLLLAMLWPLWVLRWLGKVVVVAYMALLYDREVK